MFRKLGSCIAVATLALFTAVACTNSSGSDSSPVSASQPAPRPDESVNADDYTPGEAAHTSDVVAFTVYAAGGGAASEDELAAIFAEFPSLGSDIAELASIDKGVVTTDAHVELYDGAALAMVLRVEGTAATIVWARNGFTAESVSYTSVEEGKEMNSSATFNLKACKDGKPEEDQDQGKGQVEEVCQELSATIDMNEQQQDQDQDQDQDQEKPDEDQDKP